MDKKATKKISWFNEKFIKYFARSIINMLLGFILATALTYFFIDKSIVTNPTNKTIISLSIITIIYIITMIIGWFVLWIRANR